jgi:hypothetical protein
MQTALWTALQLVSNSPDDGLAWSSNRSAAVLEVYSDLMHQGGHSRVRGAGLR